MKKQKLKLSEILVHSFVTSLDSQKQQTVVGAGTQLNPCGIRNGTREYCNTLPPCYPESLEIKGCKIESLQQTCPD